MSQDGWDKEYAKKRGIATSFKTSVSRSIRFFLEFLAEEGLKLGGKALDLGCGRGRNAIPLAQLGYGVVAIDASIQATQQFEEELDKASGVTSKIQNGIFEQIFPNKSPGLRSKIQIIYGFMEQSIPFPDNYFDLVMDITSFDILIQPEDIENHKKEIWRLLKKDGLFLWYDMADTDPYSLELPQNEGIRTDPAGIKFKTYSLEAITKIFDNFEICQSAHFHFNDRMYGKEYNRAMLCIIFKPKK